jgi:ABC-2 type transport system ATP-binding protein
VGWQPQYRPAGLLEDIYFLPEEFYAPAISAELYQQIYAPFYPRFNPEAFQEYLREFELKGGKKLSEFSYGQKKKFLLAFGLGEEDRIILISTHQVRDMENLIDPIIILDEGNIIFQQPMYEVTRRLHVELEQVQPSGDGVLYTDKTLGGYVVVRKNISGEETQADLETLFNTVIANRDRIGELFAADGMEAPAGTAAVKEDV